MIRSNGYADVYTDFRGTAALRNQARQDPNAALKETSQQFESVFIQMAMKRMRDATLKSGLTDNSRTEMFQDMHDQQLAVELGKQSKLGISDMLTRQLGGGAESNGLSGKSLDDYRQNPFYRPRGMAGNADATATGNAASVPNIEPGATAETATSGPFSRRDDFAAAIWPHAQQAAAELGVDPKLLVAQAALETGWGKSGRNNLFGIKAHGGWTGAKVTSGTTEYVNGVATRERASFRDYGSYADSFRDYVSFLKDNPRYQQALQHADNPRQFIAGLQKAGYATDPAYARKVMAIYENNDSIGRLQTV